MKNQLLTLLLLVLLGYGASAQEWVHMQNQGKSFFEIRQKMNQKFIGKSTLKNSENYSREMKQYKRWEFFWRNKVGKSGEFPNAATIYKGFKDSNKMKSKIKSNKWSFVGPSHIPTASEATYAGMGRINTIDFIDSLTWLIGSPSGGLWKTSNGGTTWTPIGDNLPVMGISDIAIDPNNSTIIYLATGDADGQQSPSVGLLKSTNGGQSFASTSLSFSTNQFMQCSNILIDPSNSNNILVSSSNGIYKSTSGATSFTKVYNFESFQLALKPGSSTIVYASLKDGMIKSTDFGSTWTTISNMNGINSGAYKVKFGLSAANPNFIFAIDSDGGASKSTNGGSSWSAVNLPVNYESQGSYNMTVAVDQNNVNTILVGGVNGWRSTNGGSSWTLYLDGYWAQGQPNFYVHSDHHIMRVAPWNNSLWFTGNDGGLHKGTLTQTNPWTDLSDGLAITQFYRMGGVKSNAQLITAGAQDNDAVTYNGTTWLNINNSTDGIDGMINYNNTQIAYAASQEGYLTKTTNSWASSLDIMPSAASYADFIWPVEMDPLNPDIIYGGYEEIYRSTNGGSSWTAITNNISQGEPFESIAIAPSNTSTIYAIDYQDILYKTTNINSWSVVSLPSSLQGEISRVTVSPNDANTVYVILTGYQAGEKVYKSTNGGQSWTNISSGLPNVAMTSIVAQSGTNEDLYVGTSNGVYTKTKNSNWTAYSTGLPNVIINDLDIHYLSSKLRAATFGRGIWSVDLATPTAINEQQASAVQLKVYPNPSSGKFTLQYQNSNVKNAKLKVFNSVGGIILSKSLNADHVSIDLSKQSDGIYFVSIISDTFSITKKITKQ